MEGWAGIRPRNGRGSGEGLSDTPGGWKTGGEGLQGGHLLPDESLDARALSIAGAFVIEIQKATDLAQVECLLEAAAHELGFRYYAMIHHDDQREASPSLINMNN